MKWKKNNENIEIGPALDRFNFVTRRLSSWTPANTLVLNNCNPTYNLENFIEGKYYIYNKERNICVVDSRHLEEIDWTQFEPVENDIVVTIGADQEYELEEAGDIVSFHGNSRLFGYDHGGATVEVRTRTGARTPEEFIKLWKESLLVGAELLKNREVKLLAGGGRETTCGGHVHIGGIDVAIADSLVDLLDIVIGRLLKTTVEGEVRKRGSYGHYHHYRNCDWGVGLEYRSLPSFFFDPEIAYLGLEIIKQVTETWIRMPLSTQLVFDGSIQSYLQVVDDNVFLPFVEKVMYYYERWHQEDVFSNWGIKIRRSRIHFSDDWSNYPEMGELVEEILEARNIDLVVYGVANSRNPFGNIIFHNKPDVDQIIEIDDLGIEMALISQEINRYNYEMFERGTIAIGLPLWLRIERTDLVPKIIMKILNLI